MTRTLQAGHGQAARRQGRRAVFGARVGAFGIVRSTKSRDRPEQGRRGFRVFGTMIPKSGNRFLEKIMIKQKGGRPNRVPPMRLDRLGEG
jgi:hypothetical protein